MFRQGAAYLVPQELAIVLKVLQSVSRFLLQTCPVESGHDAERRIYLQCLCGDMLGSIFDHHIPCLNKHVRLGSQQFQYYHVISVLLRREVQGPDFLKTPWITVGGYFSNVEKISRYLAVFMEEKPSLSNKARWACWQME